jgi:hypothetical protein
MVRAPTRSFARCAWSRSIVEVPIYLTNVSPEGFTKEMSKEPARGGTPPVPQQSRIVSPGPDARSVRTSEGQVLRVPDDWILVPPGDPGLTRRIKAAALTWTVQEKRGRKVFGRGVWVAGSVVPPIQAALEAERATPQFAKKRAAGTQRRETKQAEYVEDFRQAVLDYLAFAPTHHELAEQLADAVATHATPVGSGTVARTERIPIEQRAEAAVIAWMRHQTTAYDHMTIPREKGKRREVRRMLAARSKALLDGYRSERATAGACPLRRSLEGGM